MFLLKHVSHEYEQWASSGAQMRLTAQGTKPSGGGTSNTEMDKWHKTNSMKESDLIPPSNNSRENTPKIQKQRADYLKSKSPYLVFLSPSTV